MSGLQAVLSAEIIQVFRENVQKLIVCTINNVYIFSLGSISLAHLDACISYALYMCQTVPEKATVNMHGTN